MSVNYIDQNYYYVRNPQGDVVALVNESGEIVDEYTYDAWGKPTSTPTSRIGQFNPFRYRGYIYDDETGFYYLENRYYDPEVGRFINADGFVSTGVGILGLNMFAYCNNNPIVLIDSNGTRPIVVASLSQETSIQRKMAFASMKNQKYQLKGPDNSFVKDDGSFAFYDNRVLHPDSVFHEQIFAGKTSGSSFNLKNGKFKVGGVKVCLYTAGWETENFDLSLLDLGVVRSNAYLDLSGDTLPKVKVDAIASVWTPSLSICVWDVNVDLSAHVGSAGYVFDFDIDNGITVGGSCAAGWSISVSW